MEPIKIICFLTGLLAPSISGQDPLYFLTEGLEISYTTRTKNLQVDAHILIDFTKEQAQQILSEADDIVKFWTAYAAWQSPSDVKLAYLSLTEPAMTHLLTCAKLVDKVLAFTSSNPTVHYQTACNYTYSILTGSSMRTQLNSLKNAKNKIGVWSYPEITSDLAKDNTLRTFANTFNEMTEEWKNSLLTFINVLESLASNIVPEEIIGNYQYSTCVGTLHEEKIAVKNCERSAKGYVCLLDIQLPVIIRKAQKLIPVHYNGIKLIAEKSSQLFIQGVENNNIIILSCDHYDFEAENIPLCETGELETKCKTALRNRNIDETIKYCNFTRHDTEPTERVTNYGILVHQNDKNDIGVRRQIGNDYHLLSTTLPVLIYSPTAILVNQGHKEYVNAPLNSSIAFKTIVTALTDEQRKNLNSKLYWLEFRMDLSEDDYMQISTLILQAILYLLALVGVIFGIKLKRKLHSGYQSVHEPVERTSKSIYKANKFAMKHLGHK